MILMILGMLACTEKAEEAGELFNYGFTAACLGTDDVDFEAPDQAYREYTIVGEVVSDGVFTEPENAIESCYGMKRALVIRDYDGALWTLGYTHQRADAASDPLVKDVTPPLDVSVGELVELKFARNNNTSSGFLLLDADGMVAVQEYAIDGTLLWDGGGPVTHHLDVQSGAIEFSDDDGCATFDFNELDFSADDELSLATGEAGDLSVDGVTMTATNWYNVDINSIDAGCDAFPDYRVWSVWR